MAITRKPQSLSVSERDKELELRDRQTDRQTETETERQRNPYNCKTKAKESGCYLSYPCGSASFIHGFEGFVCAEREEGVVVVDRFFI